MTTSSPSPSVPPSSPPTPPTFDLARVRSALRPIFWGPIVVFGALKFNDIDILNDTVGYILILCGMFQLARLSPTPACRSMMLWLKPLTALLTVSSVIALFPANMLQRAHLAFVPFVVQTATGIVLVLFGVYMMWFCKSVGLDRSARSWQMTSLLMAILWPLSILVMALSGWHPPGVVLVLLLVTGFLPLIHMFVSIVRTRRACCLPPASAAPPPATS